MSYANCCVGSDIPENLEAVEDFDFTLRNRYVDSLRKVLASLIADPEKYAQNRLMKKQPFIHLKKDHNEIPLWIMRF